jgi:hypothetical protein
MTGHYEKKREKLSELTYKGGEATLLMLSRRKLKEGEMVL